MKIVVTHFSPDLDAICSTWLIRKFYSGFNQAQVKFVAAGNTLDNKKVDYSENIIHVDTGFGRFDHHQTDKKTCASKLVFEYLKKEKLLKDKLIDPLKRLTDQVTEIDHFQQVFWNDAANDRYELFIDAIIDGLHLIYPKNSDKIMELGLELIEAIFKQFENKVWAEKVIKEESIEFKSPWGKAIAINSTNDEALHLAQKMGYVLGVRKDPRKGYLRVKCIPKKNIDLTKLYKKLSEKDKQATWFLHASKHMILNGSTKNPDMIATKLSLEEVVEIIKTLKLP